MKFQGRLERKESSPAVLPEIDSFSQCSGVVQYRTVRNSTVQQSARISAVQNCTEQYSTEKCITLQACTQEETKITNQVQSEASFQSREGAKIEGLGRRHSYVVS
jgi:Tfp pilus assembly protein PilW